MPYFSPDTAGGDASGTLAALLVNQARGLKSATTTVSVSAATAPSNGQILTATSSTTAIWQAPVGGSELSPAVWDQRVLVSKLPHNTSNLSMVDGTAYWVYLGKTTTSFVGKYVRAYFGNTGTGTQTVEVATATTPSAPNCAGQTLTVLEASSGFGDLTTGGSLMRKNTSALTGTISSGVHLWVGIRVSMTAMPNPGYFLTMDNASGSLLTTAAAGALTTTTYAGSLLSTTGVSAGCPNLMLTLD